MRNAVFIMNSEIIDKIEHMFYISYTEHTFLKAEFFVNFMKRRE